MYLEKSRMMPGPIACPACELPNLCSLRDPAMQHNAYPGKTEVGGEPSSAIWTWAALIASGVAVAGGLALTLAENKQPCPLCYYQRTFAFGLVAVLGQGL